MIETDCDELMKDLTLNRLVTEAFVAWAQLKEQQERGRKLTALIQPNRPTLLQ